MISVEDWTEIRRLHRAEGLPIKQIVRVTGVSRNTVRAASRSDGPPRYERAPTGSVSDEFELWIRELLAAYPSMAASVIGERIGWPYSGRTLRTKVAELRPAAGGPLVILHYSGGTLTPAKLPVSAAVINIVSVASIPGTSQALAAGFTQVANGSDAVILEYS